jgi:hypothetical protein
MFEVRPDGTIVKPDGTQVVETWEEALALRRQIRMARPATAQTARAIPAIRRGREPKGLEFIQAAATSGKPGIGSVMLAGRLGVKHVKGLSMHAKAARLMIAELIEKMSDPRTVDKFLWKEKGREGTTWHASADRLREIGLLNNNGA